MKNLKQIVSSFFLVIFLLFPLVCFAFPNQKSKELSTSLPTFYEIDKENRVLYIFDQNGNKIQSTPYNNDGPISGKIQKVGLFSTSYFPMFDSLDSISKIKAIDHSHYCNNPNILKAFADGEIIEVGGFPNPSMEKLIASGIDSLFASPFSLKPSLLRRLKKANIRVFYFNEWLEEDPLARASWILVAGVLLGKQEEAKAAFHEITQRYIQNALHEENHTPEEKLQKKPLILSGLPWMGTWHIPGGKSYLATLIKDAGGLTIDSANTQTASRPFSPEEVITLSTKADIWLVNASQSITQKSLSKQNPLFSQIDALKNSQLYNNTKRINPHGGNDYFESAILKPDLVLSDLIEIISAFNENRSVDESKLYFFTPIQ